MVRPLGLSPEALERRSRGIGSSDAATALGLNPYKSPFRLWQEKRQEIEPEDLSGNEAVELGTLLEPVVATLFTKRTGLKLRRHNKTIEHPRYPWMVCNIDRDVVGLPKLAEIKTAGYWAAQSDEWGEVGTDAVPFRYAVQVQHQLACLPHYESGYVPLLVGGQKFRLYEVQRDPEIISMLEIFLGDFWQNVVDGIPPIPTTLAQAQERWPKSIGQSILATDVIEQHVQELAETIAAIKHLEGERKRIQGEIAVFMEGADVLMSSDGSRELLTYKTQSRAEYVAKASEFRVMRLKGQK